MALVVSMTTDVIHGFMSHTSFIYFLKLLYFSSLYFLLHRILISRYGNIHQKAFPCFHYFHFSLLFSLSEESEASRPSGLSVRLFRKHFWHQYLFLIRAATKVDTWLSHIKMLYEILPTVRSDKYRKYKLKLNSVTWVRERNILTERPPLVGEVSANFCLQRCHVVSVTDP
jgi:hypothetical protein